LQSLNAQVDIDGEDPEDVALAFLQEYGFMS
jgi:glycine betaine/choline ABC-type transport system substrate-binding protein